MRGGQRKGGGRPPGARNKKTVERLAVIESTGETPLEYMLRVMRDPKTDHERRDRLAQGAAPYVHAKLTSIEHSGKVTLSHEDALNELDERPGEGDSPVTAGQPH